MSVSGTAFPIRETRKGEAYQATEIPSPSSVTTTASPAPDFLSQNIRIAEVVLPLRSTGRCDDDDGHDQVGDDEDDTRLKNDTELTTCSSPDTPNEINTATTGTTTTTTTTTTTNNDATNSTSHHPAIVPAQRFWEMANCTYGFGDELPRGNRRQQLRRKQQQMNNNNNNNNNNSSSSSSSSSSSRSRRRSGTFKPRAPAPVWYPDGRRHVRTTRSNTQATALIVAGRATVGGPVVGNDRRNRMLNSSSSSSNSGSVVVPASSLPAVWTRDEQERFTEGARMYGTRTRIDR